MTDSPIFPGSTVTPSDPRYATLVRGFNQRWVGRPQYLQVVGDAEQIVQTIQHCVDHKLRPTVRSGGHCYEGWVSLNDGVIFDVSTLHTAGWDEENGWFFVESGCTNWDIYNQIYRQYGLTLPAGSCYSVGAGGHICGGGYGLLSRLQGLTVDWLSGVEVVVVDRDRRARLVRVMVCSASFRRLRARRGSPVCRGSGPICCSIRISFFRSSPTTAASSPSTARREAASPLSSRSST